MTFSYLLSKESRVKAINRFCALTMLFASPYIFILYRKGHIFSAVVMAVLISLFYSCIVLNKKHLHQTAKILLIFVTNFSVLYFDILLGYNSGIHLYLYTSPLIVYLLFDYKEKGKIILSLTSYLLNFFLIFLSHQFKWIEHTENDQNLINFLYTLNLTCSLILSFILIIYFAFNNSSFNELLIDINSSLENKKTELESEIEEKNRTQKELLKTLKEKDLLMAEVHHRVKNNLAFVSGLLQLQSLYVKETKASQVLQESFNRIKAISLLHEKFYESNELEKTEIAPYIKELLEFLKLSFSSEKKEIVFHTDIDHLLINLTKSMPFSLLINELVTNSFKHAFTGRNSGNIYISLKKNSSGFEFNYRDDGIGFTQTLNDKDESLGLNLTDAFTRQLKGEPQFTSEKNKGMHFSAHFNFDQV